MTTVRELADELGVSPQTIRRYARDVLGVATQPRKALQLDANQCSAISAHFTGKTKEAATEVATEDLELLQEVATLRERVAGLERENELLRERLAVADGALEREQMRARGFWSRVGQKLLGSGKGAGE